MADKSKLFDNLILLGQHGACIMTWPIHLSKPVKGKINEDFIMVRVIWEISQLFTDKKHWFNFTVTLSWYKLTCSRIFLYVYENKERKEGKKKERMKRMK